MLKTIPAPTNPTVLLVYDGLLEWFPVICDSVTGEILDDSTIPLFSNTWSWSKLEALMQDALQWLRLLSWTSEVAAIIKSNSRGVYFRQRLAHDTISLESWGPAPSQRL